MTKFFIEYSIDNASQVVGNIFTSLSASNINVDSLQEIINRIAAKENCSEIEVFIDNIAKINSN